ncbi:PIR Superfamily Protein [Plasmodium ovale wallikeri]|uniref:PIR Superfamily Protein n=1 Tax=Plasmodium ovale wallikeri TaxID=864142 RepID=A0A1A9AP34_PLAOA|nr:PIR Superfamily Protein [Plasmodium ovale wallikeri]
MTTGADAITSLECKFFDHSKVEQIYQEYVKICEANSGIQKCFTEIQDEWEYCSSVPNKLQELKSKLNQMIQTYQRELNDNFSNKNHEEVEKRCICLKQSFYNKIINDVKKPKNINKRFKTCNRDIIYKTNGVPSNLCTFRNLNIVEIVRMKMIFDFYLYYYRNIMDSTVDQKSNEHREYFIKGFYEHCNSIIQCLNDKSNSEYCDEFKEYHNKYNSFKVFLEILISYANNLDGSQFPEECILSERLLNGQYLFQLREEIERIRSRYRPTNYGTTAITVVFLITGTVIGAFLISYYFFGITPNELWLRTLKLINKEAHANLDDETESNSLFTSENQENTFKNKGYTISYKSANYS